MSDIIKTRNDEEVRILTTSFELMQAHGMFLKEALCKEWEDIFSDEDTGESVINKRKEILFDRGTELTPDLIPKINFSLQAGEITKVVVTNQRRAGYEVNYGETIYFVTALIKEKKTKFILTASNIAGAMDCVKDYIELEFIGGYKVISIKEFQTNIVLEDNLKNQSDSDEFENEEKYYQITAIIVYGDGFERATNAVVKTVDLEKAMLILDRKVHEVEKEQEFVLRLEEAKLIAVDCIISDEFCAAYYTEK